VEQALLAREAVSAGDRLVVVGALPFRQGIHTNFVKLHATGARST
jgi:hypothetical protein